MCIVTQNSRKDKTPRLNALRLTSAEKTVPSLSRQVKPHSIFLSSANDSEERNSQFEGCKRQSENRTTLRPASIASGCPPASLKRVGDLPSQQARGVPRDPPVSLADKNMSELITQQF